MSFAHSRDAHIYNSTFTDIGGDLNIYHNSTVYSAQKGLIDQSEAGLLTLSKVASTGASYDSEERRPPPKCQPGTRVEILSRIEGWTEGKESSYRRICWLHGPAGAGKSSIAQTISEKCAGRGQLAASFFFSRSTTGRDSMKNLFTTLALQLALSIPTIRRIVRKRVEEDPLIIHRETAVQLKKLIVEPLQCAHLDTRDTSRVPYLVIIDGLDECKGNSDQSLILSYMLDMIYTYHLPLRFLIVSRPEPHIRHSFVGPVLRDLTTEVSLLGDHQSVRDVFAFLRTGFDKISSSESHSATMNFVPKPWPTDDVVRLLAERSGGYFIYASTVLKYVDEEYYSCIDRLEEVMNVSSRTLDVFAELDKLYLQVLSICPNTCLLVRVLGCILLAEINDPSRIEAVLGIRPGDLMLVLRGLHSILSVGYGSYYKYIPIKPIHASLRDFLMDRDRAGVYFVDEDVFNQDMVRGYTTFIEGLEKNKHHVKAWTFIRELPYPLVSAKTTQKPWFVEAFNNYIKSGGWKLIIHDSKNLEVDAQIEMVSMLSNLITQLQRNSGYPHDAIVRGMTLLDLAFLTHLSPKSSDEVALIKGIYTRAQLGYVEPSLIIFEPRKLSPYERITRYICRGKELWGDYLISFMSDPTRCGVLYVDPRHIVNTYR